AIMRSSARTAAIAPHRPRAPKQHTQPVHRDGVSMDLETMAQREASPFDGEADGRAMMALIEELFPICRSITGNGVRQTLEILQRHVPLKVNEVPSGTKVLDWTVPHEWNTREAYIARQDGTRVVDFAKNNLHVLQYSRPIDTTMALADLRPHLH